MLARYLITSLCIGTIDVLLLKYFDWAAFHFAVGLAVCLVVLLAIKVRQRLR